MTRIVIVDDQPLVRSGLRSILERQPEFEVVGEADDGAAALELCGRERPDVVLMDIRMPGLDGLEASRRLLAQRDAPRVLVITTFDLDEYVYEALKAGASGYLLKDARPEEIVHAVRLVAAGDSPLAPQVTRRLIEEYLDRPRPDDGERPSGLAELTGRETEVLQALARGLSNAEIAARLFLSEATVKAHVTRVLAKLGLRDRLQAAVFAYENGVVRPGGR